MLNDIIFSMVIGGTVGIVGHVRKHGKIIMPRKTKRFIYLGFLEELLLGAVSALLIMIYTTPNSMVETVFLSALAGISGDIILTNFRSLTENKEKES
ncbi:DUF4257 domain-containing protein [Neobacillus sp. DY30]|uniref:DUF4257 domain-containing protein n=1 Tax=Neobacillus sp. DY30 TaxID=3047871 RepID=UPI0024C06B36|nr:DUF4257 domain-containing protein [Neobacillus sp. DY30]WHY02566.1 DUF4257 domain-containing protein [Neobacillus sp. DY30]